MQNNELTGEPAIWASLLGSGVQLLAAFFLPISDAQVALINAAILAAAGVYVAFRTKAIDNGGSIKSALLGFTQSAISLGLAFGWHASNAQTASIMTFVGLAVAAFVRQTSMVKPAGLSAVRR
ncbi:hypothetical protein J5X84_36050 [Streptosporangiaceae bacterium NEAU-GS5]|nr:hypothetical protein [Streptosporangiaceae bacterium NEAU-GS5]